MSQQELEASKEPKLPPEEIAKLLPELIQQKKEWLDGLEDFIRVKTPDFWTTDGTKETRFTSNELDHQVTCKINSGECEELTVARELRQKKTRHEFYEALVLKPDLVNYQTLALHREDGFSLLSMGLSGLAITVKNFSNTQSAVEMVKNF